MQKKLGRTSEVELADVINIVKGWRMYRCTTVQWSICELFWAAHVHRHSTDDQPMSQWFPTGRQSITRQWMSYSHCTAV